MAIVARVVLSFSMNADPETLLREARCVEQPFVQRMTRCCLQPTTGECCGRKVECRPRFFCGPQGICGSTLGNEPDFHTEAPLVVQVCVMSPEANPDKNLVNKDCMSSTAKSPT